MNHSQAAIWTWKPRPAGAGHRLDAGHVRDRDEGHEHRGDLDDEHDRVLDQAPRVELADRLGEGGAQEVGIEHAARPGWLTARLGATGTGEALEAARAPPEIDAEEGHD